MKASTRIVGVVSESEVWLSLQGAELPCDWVELRVDALAPEERLLALRKPCPKPLLLTPRHESEGGRCRWDAAERLRWARELLPAAAALDWEIAQFEGAQELLAEAKKQGVIIIGSAHYFEGMPSLEEMLQLEQKAKDGGADIVKIAFTPANEEEMMRGVKFLQRPRVGIRAAIMGMGPLALASRSLYTQHGSALLYGYLGATPTAPGQLSARQCRSLLTGLSQA